MVKRFARYFGIAGVVMLAGAVVHTPAQNAGKFTWSRIEKKTYDFKDAGKEMEYALFVPSTYDKAKKSPLVIALHGLGSNPQQMIRYPGLTDLAEKYGFIVAAPMGYSSRGWYGQPIPRKFANKADPDNMPELSEKDVMNVLAIVRKDYKVDDQRIYLMGHSMGGGGTWHLALKHPEIWAALAPIAPAIFRPESDVAKIKHVPVILVQGEDDKLVPVARARRWAGEMKKQGMTYEYIEVKGGDHVFVAFKNLPAIFAFFDKHKKKSAEKR
jgi:poly(3-hydroxybutyrate) depolymerase